MRLFATVNRELALLRALVNNAGTTGRSGRRVDLDAATIAGWSSRRSAVR
jgi:hypothetical protein